MKPWELERDQLIEDTLVFLRSVAVPRPNEDVSMNATTEVETEASGNVHQLALDASSSATPTIAAPAIAEPTVAALTVATPAVEVAAPAAAAPITSKLDSEGTASTNSAPQPATSSIAARPIDAAPQTAPAPATAAKPSLGNPQQASSREQPRAKVSGAERDSATQRTVTPYTRVRRHDVSTSSGIQDRVAAFRAHQMKLLQEREAYFDSVQTRIKSELSQRG